MRRNRRRYEVVVEGVSGPAAAQRSVIAEHRSADDAREDAAIERARLEVIYGEAAASWRVVVIHDDRVVHEERPAGRAAPPAPAPTPTPVPPLEEMEDRQDEDEAESEPAEEAEPAPEGPVPDWLIERMERSIAREQERSRGD